MYFESSVVIEFPDKSNDNRDLFLRKDFEKYLQDFLFISLWDKFNFSIVLFSNNKFDKWQNPTVSNSFPNQKS